ncbi:MAG: glucose-6-phosphate dehydrogenase [Candidatus Levyibacteriota bacterium]
MNSPFAMIIFGATGDLMRTKLLPSLFKLFQEKKLPEKFYLIGFARREFTNSEFHSLLKEFLHSNNTYRQSDWDAFSKNIFYQQGKFEEKEDYEELIKKLEGFDKEIGACVTRLFYLATPPANYPEILEHLNHSKLSEGCGQGSNKWTKIIIEKPFGKDLETARALDKRLSEIFEERQIFRVDHYLGKETVQNMIAFRFANGIFEPVWNKNFIDHVQITLAEEKGIERRGKFFDGVGTLRDMGQNHIMQMVAAVAMEQPRSFTRDDMRDVRANAIKAIRSIESNEVDKFVARGQYEGYLKEKDVDPKSNTETFVAMKLYVDSERFKNVPFYARVGKKMPKSTVEISIVFIQTCHVLFKEYGCPETGNVLTIRIQPNEGISLRVIAKKPGSKVSLGTVNMNFNYEDEFHTKGTNAYEKVLLDIFVGDQMLFNRSDELDSSWEFITKILEGWKRRESGIMNYESGTWGPKEANELIQKDGRKWIQ